ncbi:hypothetical protein EPO15_18620 [bacterium]|nr:MAG: hypothetical protein EPO15_18620 [bacterium]
MLKAQRAVGLLLVALGGAGEVVGLDSGLFDAVVLSHCAAAFGAALYALTMTGRLTDALTALLPVPVLAPAAAVLLAWKRGDLARPAPQPRRTMRFAEGAGLALALAALGEGAHAYGPALWDVPAAVARETPKALPAPVAAPVESEGTVLYQVHFLPGKAELTDEGRALLDRIADTMHYYPLDDLQLSAAAPTGEPDVTALSLARLEEVEQGLADRGLARSRIHAQLRRGVPATTTVDVVILPP